MCVHSKTLCRQNETVEKVDYLNLSSSLLYFGCDSNAQILFQRHLKVYVCQPNTRLLVKIICVYEFVYMNLDSGICTFQC